MSLGTLLQKVGTWISGLFSKASNEIETVVLPAAIAVTNALKTVIDADTTDILGKLVGSAGAGVEDKVRQILDQVVQQLQLAQQFQGQDPATILANIVKLLGNSPTITKTAFYIEFSGMVAQAWEDGKVDLGEAAALAKYFYENEPKATTAPAPTS